MQDKCKMQSLVRTSTLALMDPFTVFLPPNGNNEKKI